MSVFDVCMHMFCRQRSCVCVNHHKERARGIFWGLLWRQTVAGSQLLWRVRQHCLCLLCVRSLCVQNKERSARTSCEKPLHTLFVHKDKLNVHAADLFGRGFVFPSRWRRNSPMLSHTSDWPSSPVSEAALQPATVPFRATDVGLFSNHCYDWISLCVYVYVCLYFLLFSMRWPLTCRHSKFPCKFHHFPFKRG